MHDENFLNQVLKMEKEVLALKQKQGVVAVSPAYYYTATQTFGAGRHTITYGDGDQPIMTFITPLNNSTLSGATAVATPVGNKQYFWIPRQSSISGGLLFTSNRKIISVE